MCLAVPGMVVEWVDREIPFARAQIAFGGVRREVNMQCVPDAAEGDYVLVHAGIAIIRIDSVEAERLLQSLDALRLLDDDSSQQQPTEE